MVLLGDKAKTEGTSNVGAKKDEDEKAATVVETIVEQDACQNGEGDEGAVRNLHQSRDKCAEAETLDNNRSLRSMLAWIGT
jgi:hypothetical protein